MSESLILTPQILSLSHHRALSLFQASDLIYLQSWIFLWWVFSDPCCSSDCDLLGHHSAMSTRWTSPDLDGWVQVCHFLRLPQLFTTRVAFLLVVNMGIENRDIGNWSMFSWCFCFTVTLIISIVELCRLLSSFPFFWYNLSVTYTCYAALICLLASIIYSISLIQFLPKVFTGTRPSPPLRSPASHVPFMPWMWPSRRTATSWVISPAVCTPCQACWRC